MKRFMLVSACLLASLAILRAEKPVKVDLLLTAAHVVTMDQELHIFEPGAVAIDGGRIVAVGPRADVAGRVRAARKTDLGDRWVMPGLVNTHTHIAMNLMRGLGDDLELMEWLTKYIFPLEAKVVDARYVYEASLAGCAEMISRGVTTAVDMYYFEDEVARAVREAGLRGWLGQTVIDFKAPDFATPDDSLAYTEKCLVKWAADPLVKVIPAPHSGYTCSPETLRKSIALARQHGVLMTTHLAESQKEVADIQKKYGRTPVQHLAGLGVLGSDLLAAHCVQLTEADLQTLKETGTSVAHNPDSNLKLASGIAPVVAMRRLGIPVGLGTDGSVSNNRLDMFHAMDLAAKIHKLRENDAAVLKAAEAVRMATCDAAAAIGAGGAIGSLEAGKQADLIVLDLDTPMLQPVYNVYSHLVYVAHGESVESTMVAGRWLMKNRKLTTIAPGRLKEIYERYSRLMKASLEGQQ